MLVHESTYIHGWFELSTITVPDGFLDNIPFESQFNYGNIPLDVGVIHYVYTKL